MGCVVMVVVGVMCGGGDVDGGGVLSFTLLDRLCFVFVFSEDVRLRTTISVCVFDCFVCLRLYVYVRVYACARVWCFVSVALIALSLPP